MSNASTGLIRYRMKCPFGMACAVNGVEANSLCAVGGMNVRAPSRTRANGDKWPASKWLAGKALEHRFKPASVHA